MPETPAQGSVLPAPTSTGTAKRRAPFIFMAGPLSPMGGGMYKVAEYLIQSQVQGEPPAGSAALRPLETRGSRGPAWSMVVLLGALLKIAMARLGGGLAGVHINMAERLSLVRKGAMVAWCRLLGVPVVLHLHAAQLPQNYHGMNRWAQRCVRWVFAQPACCIVLGQRAADFVTRELQVSAERVQIVINGVPQPQAARRAAGSLGKRLLFVGNLSERKGVTDLLHALAHPVLAQLQVTATLAGGGDVAHYRAVAASLGLAERTRFEGWSDQRKVAQLLSEADVFTLPSYDEGLPLAILEAMAHGVPVVCTPVGEIPHVMAHGRDALFVQPGDRDALARALAQVLCDPALAARLEHNGLSLYQQSFSMPGFFANVAAVHRRYFGVSAIEARSGAAAQSADA